MANQETLALSNAQEIIESQKLSFWQKYVKGINMTFIDCDFRLQNCSVSRNQNQFYIYVHHKNVYYIEVDEDVSYHSSLTTPILKEIGTLVNYSMHLLVGRFGENQYIESLWVQTGKIDGTDHVPLIYDKEVGSQLSCANTLYLSNQLSILSPIIKSGRPTTLDIYKAFDIQVWIFILLAFIFVVLTTKLISMAEKHKRKSYTIFHLIWIYFKPLIGIGEHLIYFNNIYILWVLSVFSLTEILKNEVFSKLVAVPNVYVNNIEDLLDDKWDPLTRSQDLLNFKRLAEESSDNSLSEKCRKLFNKSHPLKFVRNGEWTAALDTPKLFIKKSV